MNKCIDCEHFLGGGDWNLCCSEKYDLCYPNTDACELFSQVKEFYRDAYIQHGNQIACPWCNSVLTFNGVWRGGGYFICPGCKHNFTVRDISNRDGGIYVD